MVLEKLHSEGFVTNCWNIYFTALILIGAYVPLMGLFLFL